MSKKLSGNIEDMKNTNIQILEMKSKIFEMKLRVLKK